MIMTLNRGAVLATVPAVAALLFAPASTHADITIDFDSLLHGEIVTNQVPGVAISAINPNRDHDLAIIFDTNERDTEDDDLEGPGWDFGNLPSRTDLGNLLIISENDRLNDRGLIARPDDEGSRPAGSLLFDLDVNGLSVGFDLVDVESPETRGGSVELWLDRALVGAVAFADFLDDTSDFYDPTVEFGNRSANRISPIAFNDATGGLAEFNRVVFNMGGSGGIDNIVLTQVPAPASFALLAMGGLVCTRRRRG